MIKSMNYKHTNKKWIHEVQKHLFKFHILQCYIPKLEKFNEFASDKTEKTSTMNCFHREYCGQMLFSVIL
jgi:hypothetical protein